METVLALGARRLGWVLSQQAQDAPAPARRQGACGHQQRLVAVRPKELLHPSRPQRFRETPTSRECAQILLSETRQTANDSVLQGSARKKLCITAEDAEHNDIDAAIRLLFILKLICWRRQDFGNKNASHPGFIQCLFDLLPRWITYPSDTSSYGQAAKSIDKS